ncbi:MAG: dihydropteroate synthase [Paludibacteraceae bacterium]|nr:dihydropteroate synthase [Paludibacteraceae bacterium]
MEMSIRIHNQVMSFSRPRVMAIINLSPDSFYTSCDITDEQFLLSQVESALDSGADILDIGACSTRPNSQPVKPDIEWQLLSRGLDIIRHHWSDTPISVDTFRPEIAQQAIAHGADMINDVSGANANRDMWNIVAKYRIPYVMTHSQPITTNLCSDSDFTITQVLDFLQQQVDLLHRHGVADTIIDPGFGFGKTIMQNYTILRHLDILQVIHAPILVGISRKSMLYQPLGNTPQDVLPATVAANVLALERGANILRVHDIEAARQAIEVFNLTSSALKL